MKRQVMDSLISWKKNTNRGLLVLRGASGVGKTWILKDFGAREFSSSAYISFASNRRMARLFEGDLSPQRLLEGFEMESGARITADSLLILDDVEAIPGSVAALARLCGESPDLFVAAAVSRRDPDPPDDAAFRAFKIYRVDMYPLTFGEFLEASGEGKLRNALKIHNFDLLHVFGDRLLDLVRTYLFVGGMPEAVLVFTETGDPAIVREIQNRILNGIEQDFVKAPKVLAKKMSGIWESIPAQLASGTRRFLFASIRKGARAEEYEKPLKRLSDAGLVLPVPRADRIGISLAASEGGLGWRLYYLDVGLLGAACDAGADGGITGSVNLDAYDGALLRQYVCQELTAAGFAGLYFWSAVNSIGDMDFLFESTGFIVPIEVQAKENLKAKNLKSFCDRFRVEKAMRFSASDYRDEKFLTNVPLYAIGWMAEFPRKRS